MIVFLDERLGNLLSLVLTYLRYSVCERRPNATELLESCHVLLIAERPRPNS